MNVPLNSPRYFLGRVVVYTGTITLSSFYFGYNIGVFNSCQDSVAAALNWGQHKALLITLFTAAFPLGAMLTSLGAGQAMEKWGKRRVSLWAAVASVFVSLLNVVPTTYTFGLARLLAGAVCGFMAALPPLFLNDVSPMELYGRASLVIQSMLTLGIVIAQALALPLPTEHYAVHNTNWIWMLVFGFPAVVMSVQMLLLWRVARFESPEWSLRQGKREAALQFYQYMYREEAAYEALAQAEAKMMPSQQELKSPGRMADSRAPVSLKEFLTTAKYRRMLAACFALQFLQQWSGVNAIFSYSTSMFPMPVMEARLFSLMLGLMNMVTSLAGAPFVDKYGRRVLMLLGTAGCFLSLAAAGVASLLSITILSVLTMLAFILFFELSLGPLVWVYTGELLFDRAMSVAVLINWASYFLVVLTFPLLKNVGIWYCFWLYGILLLLGEIYFWCALIETKGLSKQEIQVRFMRTN